jgi:phosphatidylglycerophosphatase A
VVTFVATGAYAGYSPIAPGTVGTLVGVAVFIPLSSLNVYLYSLTVLCVLALACFVSGRAEKILGQRDSPHIVIDEILGYLVAMFQFSSSVRDIVLGFLLFRFFDIAKPFPIRLIESKMSGGYGVVLDDFAAGLYANLLHRLILHF